MRALLRLEGTIATRIPQLSYFADIDSNFTRRKKLYINKLFTARIRKR